MAIVGVLDILVGAKVGDLTKGLSTASERIKQFGASVSSVGKKLTLGLTTPLALIGKQAVDLASDLGESMSKVEVVFGSMAGQIKAAAESMSMNLGLVQSDALDSMASLASMGQAMGLTGEQAADMAIHLTALSADMASFYNADPTDMLLKMQSAISGEIEPLRRFGVVLSDARVTQEALRLGLAATKDDLTDADKAWARYTLIIQDTADAQGDFARTLGESLPNQLRQLKADVSNVAAILGEVMIPTVRDIVSTVREWAVALRDMDPETAKLVVQLGALAAAAGPVIWVFGRIVTGIGAVVGAISTLGGWISSAAGWLAGFGTAGLAMAGVWTVIAGGIGAGVGTIVSHWDELGIAWRQLLLLIVRGAQKLLSILDVLPQQALMAIDPLGVMVDSLRLVGHNADQLAAALDADMTRIEVANSRAAQSSRDSSGEMAAAMQEAAAKVKTAAEQVQTSVEATEDAFAGAFTGMASIAEGAAVDFDGAMATIGHAAKDMAGEVENAWTAARRANEGSMRAMEERSAAGWQGISTTTQTGTAVITATIGEAADTSSAVWDRGMTKIKTSTTTAMEETAQTAEQAAARVEAAAGRIGSSFSGFSTSPSGFANTAHIGGSAQVIESWWQQLIDKMGGLIFLAHGGIVRKPTLAMVGEAGPEAVVPLSRGLPSLAPSTTETTVVNVTVNVGGNVLSDNDLVEAIRRGLARINRRNALAGGVI